MSISGLGNTLVRLGAGALLVGSGAVALQATAAPDAVAVGIHADRARTASVTVSNNGGAATCYATPDGDDLALTLVTGTASVRVHAGDGCGDDIYVIDFDVDSGCADRGGSLSVEVPEKVVRCFAT